MNAFGLEHRLNEIAEVAWRRSRAPGLSIAVSAGGERAAVSLGTTASASGIPMTPAARFQLGCITKMLTCVAAMQLVHDGRLDLDAAISSYLPELTVAARKADILIRHLGSHTSGYRGLNPARPEYGYFYSWAKFVDYFQSTDQVFPPGSVFNYDHTECVILGEVIRRICGRPAESLVRDLLLDPLQLTTGSIERDGTQAEVRVADHSLDATTGLYAPVRSVPYCSFWASSLASMTMSPSDLVSLAEILCGSRRALGICGEAIDDVLRQVINIPRGSGGPEREVTPSSFGFGCAQYSPGILGHNGSARGQTCGLRFAPAAGVVVVVALNCWDPFARDSVLHAVLQSLLPDQFTDSDAPAPPQPQLRLDELEGMYAGCVQGVEVQVLRKGEQLVCEIGGLAAGGTQTLTVEMISDPAGGWRARSHLKHLSIAFFREATTGTPAMLVGLNAFKKLSSA